VGILTNTGLSTFRKTRDDSILLADGASSESSHTQMICARAQDAQPSVCRQMIINRLNVGLDLTDLRIGRNERFLSAASVGFYANRPPLSAFRRQFLNCR